MNEPESHLYKEIFVSIVDLDKRNFVINIAIEYRRPD